MFAASAIAANTFLRSLAGAGFPLFATQMIKGMGVQWAGTLLGCVSLARIPQSPRTFTDLRLLQVAFALVPMPVYFYLRGSKIREKSNFAPTFPMATQAAHSPSESDDPGNEKLE